MSTQLWGTLGVCALVVCVTLNDVACGAFLHAHGNELFRAIALLFVVGTTTYLAYRVFRCLVGDDASRRRGRDQLRMELGRSGALLLGADFKMISFLFPRHGHHLEWLSWLSFAWAGLGFLVRPTIRDAVGALRSRIGRRFQRVTTTPSYLRKR